ncbi:hypothetical protein [Serinicoccus hydrothermalis]|uniref:hypothetical protein n=1 Tax=Serinicoccus hydrothermalis TaxID=1758689 RepID=UPI000A43A18A|nr:hypothetical protein [Serinicoccus hydrothermalis]
MMIRPAELAAIREGQIDLAFRRWDRPRVKVGTRLRTAVGLIEVTSVEQVAASSLQAEDARRAGAASLAALRAGLAARAERPAYRVGLRYAGPDPRTQLREQIPDTEEIGRLRAWMDRLDAASGHGPWTRETLRAIDENPGVRAPELAEELGRETLPWKADVRKLKGKGSPSPSRSATASPRAARRSWTTAGRGARGRRVRSARRCPGPSEPRRPGRCAPRASSRWSSSPGGPRTTWPRCTASVRSPWRGCGMRWASWVAGSPADAPHDRPASTVPDPPGAA